MGPETERSLGRVCVDKSAFGFWIGIQKENTTKVAAYSEYLLISQDRWELLFSLKWVQRRNDRKYIVLRVWEPWNKYSMAHKELSRIGLTSKHSNKAIAAAIHRITAACREECRDPAGE